MNNLKKHMKISVKKLINELIRINKKIYLLKITLNKHKIKLH